MNPYDKFLGEEDHLQGAIVRYVKAQYNGIVIPCNTEGRKSKFERYKFKATGGRRGVLDLFIAEPRNGYHGLFIELKSINNSPFKMNGELKAGEHLQDQQQEIDSLNSKGYFATFGIGFEATKEIIDNYFRANSGTL